MKANTHLLTIARLILWPAAALSAWGNVELFGGNTGLSQGIVLVAAIGLELGMMTLITLGARERSLRLPALAVGGVLLLLSLGGQYAFLLSRASGHEEGVKTAATTAQAAHVDQDAIRSELSTVQAALTAEQASGWGKKAQALADRADALRAKLDGLTVTADMATATQAHRSPLLVLTERFNLDPDLTLKIASALFLLGVNVAGFLLLYAASMTSAPAPEPASTPKTNGHAHKESEASPAKLITPRGIDALFPPAPSWMDQARLNIQQACAPSPLDITLGKRPALA